MVGDTVDCSVLSLVVFTVEEQRYALHLHTVEQVLPMIEVSPLPKAPAITVGVINLRGRVIPVIAMRQRLGLPPRDSTLSDHLLVTRTARRTLALLVDQVLEVKEVAAEDVTASTAVLPGIGHIAGIVAVADGLLFIDDLHAFLSLEEERQLDAALSEERTFENP